jgi:hypothetical protein
MPIGFLLMAFLIAVRLLVRGVPGGDTLAGRSEH